MNTTNKQDDDYEYLTIAEIRQKFPSVAIMMDCCPATYNVWVYPRCKQYPDGNVHLTVGYKGHPEHVEAWLATSENEHRVYRDTLPEIEISIPEIEYEWLDDTLTRAIAEAIVRCPLPLEKGVWLKNHQTDEQGQFQEWALGDELQIVVIPYQQNKPKIWNLEDVLV